MLLSLPLQQKLLLWCSPIVRRLFVFGIVVPSWTLWSVVWWVVWSVVLVSDVQLIRES